MDSFANLATLGAQSEVKPATVAEPCVSIAGFTPVALHRKIKVAIFGGTGTSESRAEVVAAISKDPSILVSDITVEEIVAGKLSGCDVVVHTGGSGGAQGKALGEAGRAAEQAFLHKGGGYLGICAGSYLASCDYEWSLHILNAKVLDKSHWARGHGPVEIAPTPGGKALLGAQMDRITIIYWQGPIFVRADDPTLPAYTELARFAGEVHKEGVPGGVMPGKTAVACGAYGDGRVICFSPHAEKTPGQESLLHHAIVWAAGQFASHFRPR